jgi:polyhydroxybutyrate depolymerase
MTMSKFITFAGTIAALSSLSFAWSITGGVFTNMGQPIPGVKITSSNYPDVNATTTDGGSFSITGGTTDALRQTYIAKETIHFDNNVISITNVKANTITVSVMDALGKVAFSQTQHNVNGTLNFDLNRTSAKGAKYIRINADGHRNTYQLGKTVSLLKEGDPLPILIFVKDGYENHTYTMKAETETDVFIQMQPGTSQPLSSATVEPPKSSADATSSTTEPTSSSATVPASSETVSSSSAAPAIDCSAKTLKSDTEITVDGRKVIVKFPPNFANDKPVPMLINYHQIFGSAADWVNDSKIGKVALADGAISIYPDGRETPGGQLGQAWNVGPCCTTADDVTFTRNFIKALTEQACVDPKRIYAAGWSMGGGMSNYAGCFLADVIAAAAPSAFDLAQEVVDAGCHPARPFPILNFRSTNDGVVSYNHTTSQIIQSMPITFMGAKENLAEWVKMDGCTGEPKKTSQKINNGQYDCEIYETCQGGAKVGLCTMNIDHNEGDANMAWDFLKQFSLP